MAWIEMCLDTTGEAVDWVRTLLAETQDVETVHITEYGNPVLDPTAEQALSPQWDFTIHFYLPYDQGARGRVEKIAELLSPLHRTGLTSALETTIVETREALAQATHQPCQRIGERFIVVPPNAPYQPTAEEVVLTLPPSLAFGSGLHPATIAILQLLERYVLPGMNTLDLGSGSGILSVAMAKLGAQVLALDNDRVSVQASQDAVLLNRVEHRVTVREGSLGCGSGLGHWMGGHTANQVPTIPAIADFDLITANILARIHLALAKDYRQALRRTPSQAGLLLTAGFTSDQEETVTACFQDGGFEWVDCVRLKDWVALAFRLP